MKKLIFEYIKVISYTIMGLIFGLVFFLLFVNFYHYREVNNVYVKSNADFLIVNDINDAVNLINNNISSFDMNTYKGTEDVYSLNNVKTRIDVCTKKLKNSKVLDILSKKEVNIKDVYDLQQLFQTEVVNDCLVKQLYDLTITDEKNSIKIASLNNYFPFIKDNIDQFLTSTTYIQNTIKNNSSYSFSSYSSKLNVFDITKDSYYSVVGSYKKTLVFLVDFSNWYSKVVRGEI